MKRFSLILLCAALVLCTLAGCGKTEDTAAVTPEVVTPSAAAESTPTPTAEPTLEPTPTPEPTPEFTNPLTGEATETDISGNRPVAIMLNNHEEAQPQYGIGSADILYEAPVEGWVTRMMGVFQDPSKVGTFGSVRSARPYFVELVNAYDAIYFHAGGSTDGMNLIWDYDISNIDATYDDCFHWDAWRAENLGTEHSLMLSQEELQAAISYKGYTTAHRDGFSNSMTFSEDAPTSGGSTANQVVVEFSTGGKTSTFTYEASKGGYTMDQYGADYIDADTEKEVVVQNLIILQTTIYCYDGNGHLKADLLSGGDAVFCCEGKYIPVTWSRGEGEEIVYKDASGEVVPFQTGHTYVCLISYDNSTYSIQ